LIIWCIDYFILWFDSKKVKVLYDFTAESANEVSTFVGEELTVLDPNSYEGWLKIRNVRGEEGIVPTAYVEFMEDVSGILSLTIVPK
jgi:hypothetical protein